MTKQQPLPIIKAANNMNEHSITMPFTEGLTIKWHSISSNLHDKIPNPLKDWLLDDSSLTRRLLNQCEKFEVQVLPNTQNVLSADELSMFEEANIICREVLLICDGVAQVYARTLLPLTTFNKANEQLKTLKNSSLGDVLFNDPSMERSEIDVCFIPSPSKLATLSQELALPNCNSIWGRRSMFYLNNYPLSVAEFFLPGSHAYSKALL